MRGAFVLRAHPPQHRRSVRRRQRVAHLRVSHRPSPPRPSPRAAAATPSWWVTPTSVSADAPRDAHRAPATVAPGRTRDSTRVARGRRRDPSRTRSQSVGTIVPTTEGPVGRPRHHPSPEGRGRFKLASPARAEERTAGSAHGRLHIRSKRTQSSGRWLRVDARGRRAREWRVRREMGPRSGDGEGVANSAGSGG